MNVRTGHGQAINETLLAECENNPSEQRGKKHNLIGLHFSANHSQQRFVSNAECRFSKVVKTDLFNLVV